MNKLLPTTIFVLGFIGQISANQLSQTNIDAIKNYFAKSRVEWTKLAKEQSDELIWNQLLVVNIDDVLHDQEIIAVVEKMLSFETTKSSEESPLEMVQFMAEALRPIVESSKSSEEEQLRCTIVFLMLEALID